MSDAVIDQVVEEVDLQPLDMSEDEKNVVDIQNKLNGIQQVADEMTYVGGVKQANVVALESYMPGIITNQRPLKTFTEDYSRNNFKVAMENIEAAKPFLIGGLIAAVGYLLYKVIKWVIGFFKKGSGGDGGGGDNKDIPGDAANAEAAAEELKPITKELVDEARKAENFNEKEVLDKWKKAYPDDKRIQSAHKLDDIFAAQTQEAAPKEKAESFRNWNMLAEDVLMGGKYYKAANTISVSLAERVNTIDSLTKSFLEEASKLLADQQGAVSTYTVESPALNLAATELNVHGKTQSPKDVADAIKADFIAARSNKEVKHAATLKTVGASHLFKSELYNPDQKTLKHWEDLQSRAQDIIKKGKTANTMKSDAANQIKKAVEEINNTIMTTAMMFFISKTAEQAATNLAQELVSVYNAETALKAKLLRELTTPMEPSMKQKFHKLLSGVAAKFKGKGKPAQPQGASA